MDKAASDTNLLATPPNYVFQRVKRSWDDDMIHEQLDELKKEMREMMEIFSGKQASEIQQISLTLNEIQKSNTKIENSIAYVTAQNEELQLKIKLLETQAKEDRKYITLLENKLEETQLGTRKSNFVIKNVPRKNNESKEDLIGMAMCLSQNLDCKISRYDIKDIYRVRGKTTDIQNTPIIVETGSTLLKAEIMTMGKAFNIKHKSKLCCKHLGFKTQEDTPIFIAEHLTPKASRLHFLARDLTKSGAYKFCWTAYGKVYLKKDEQSQPITVRSEDQVHQLMVRN
ncbi:hypothetical protein PYW07_004701 [Mythimna separata]|uniref:FP protein C-terminal domain-containing protein n=1 Tax=Mythimna separata TaxID=271217 RepID=A0AAD7YYY8_MYTSE|nr:hypothetical protein PYW07_004701 [Mythimna separata]